MSLTLILHVEFDKVITTTKMYLFGLRMEMKTILV